MTAPPTPHVRGDEWEVRTAGRPELLDLVREHHYARGASNTATYRHGLYTTTAGVLGWPHGAAIWIPPTRSAAERTILDAAALGCNVVGIDWRDVLACSRLVVAPDVATNGASLLLGRSMRLIDRHRWPLLVTYADTGQGHTGAIYRATNWLEVGPVPAGDTWVGPDGEQRGRKRGGVTWTRSAMVEAGFTQAPPNPKIKFVHVLGKRRPR